MAHTSDDGFHEIQLNGKQLVFLFMAATVVSVVIFLCGVLVGRGVRSERAAMSNADASASNTAVPGADQPPTPAPAPGAEEDPTKASPPPTPDDRATTNAERRDKPGGAIEESTEPAPAVARNPSKTQQDRAKPAPVAPPAAAPAPAASPEPPAAAKPSAAKPPAPPAAQPSTAHGQGHALAEPSGNGYAVQVAALNARGEAETIANRLSAKGYSAYIVSPANGTSMFRVRVGKFGSRREAESVATRLQKEERFKPWITR